MSFVLTDDGPLVVEGNFVEQVDQIQSFSAVFGNVANADVLQEFAWSNDGVTFSQYLTISDATLQAQVVDKDLPLYLNTRFTRTSGTGTWTVFNFTYIHTFDLGAAIGVGSINNLTKTDDLIELFTLIFTQYNFLIDGNPHFIIQYGNRDKCPIKDRPVLYFWGITYGEPEQANACDYLQPVTMRLGIKRDNCDKAQQGFNVMRDRIYEIFQPRNIRNWDFSFTFKNTVFNDVQLSIFGITDTAISNPLEFFNDDGCVIAYEFAILFKIRFPWHRGSFSVT